MPGGAPRKLPDYEREAMLIDAREGCTQTELAALYGVGQSTVSRILREQGAQSDSPRRKRYAEEVKHQAREMHRGGRSLSAIARELGVSGFTVRRWTGHARTGSSSTARA